MGIHSKGNKTEGYYFSISLSKAMEERVMPLKTFVMDLTRRTNKKREHIPKK
jgi:hypothetical protein